MTLIQRSSLLDELNSVKAGISPKHEVEQSDCFVFDDGNIMTFNEEVACKSKSIMPPFSGAVKAAPLLSLLEKMTEDEVDIVATGSKIVITGSKKQKEAGLKLDKEIQLPVSVVEAPDNWKRMPEFFVEAVDLVHQSASSDKSTFLLTCVHIHPKWIEACDDCQITRYKLDTGVESSLMVREVAIKNITGGADFNKFCVTNSWIHFKSSKGLVMSCRLYREDYPKLSKFLKVEGHQIPVPKGLKEAAERAEIFIVGNADSNTLHVEISNGRVRIRGEGEDGYYTERRKIKYNGEPLAFNIPPKMLKELVDRKNEVIISNEKIKIAGGKYDWVAALESPKDKEEDNEYSRRETEEPEADGDD